ncbi:hypothetical protein Pelo_2398 [Pelomyxa schiedti]|nr:hypothetical protein Pelo_2398 [Pelomyxa schiedti]
MNDGHCDIECYGEATEWDGGDCYGLCNPGCQQSDIDDGYCNPWCMTNDCQYDGGDCGESACGDWTCEEVDWGDGICNIECDNSDCDRDMGDCDDTGCAFCATGCPQSDVGDGRCNFYCDNEACSYDGGDCDEILAGYCSSGCLETSINDGICDSACYTELCDWDGNDCDSTFCGDVACPVSKLGDGHRIPNFGVACMNKSAFGNYLSSWFTVKPAWTATWANPVCEGDPLTVTYWSNADCLLMDNNLWGYYEWSSQGIQVQHLCTDNMCEDCFVQPNGQGVLSRNCYECWSDYDGFTSHKASPGGSSSSGVDAGQAVTIGLLVVEGLIGLLGGVVLLLTVIANKKEKEQQRPTHT